MSCDKKAQEKFIMRCNVAWSTVEMMVTLVIIGIFALFISLKAYRSLEESKINRLIKDFIGIASAARRHYSDTGIWPPAIDNPPYGDGFITNNANVTYWDGPYLDKWPLSPWSHSYNSTAAYRWQSRDIDGDSDNEWIVEIGLANLSPARRSYIGRLADRNIDGGDGPCSGKIQGDHSDCSSWSATLRPGYVAFDP